MFTGNKFHRGVWWKELSPVDRAASAVVRSISSLVSDASAPQAGADAGPETCLGSPPPRMRRRRPRPSRLPGRDSTMRKVRLYHRVNWDNQSQQLNDFLVDMR